MANILSHFMSLPQVSEQPLNDIGLRDQLIALLFEENVVGQITAITVILDNNQVLGPIML